MTKYIYIQISHNCYIYSIYIQILTTFYLKSEIIKLSQIVSLTFACFPFQQNIFWIKTYICSIKFQMLHRLDYRKIFKYVKYDSDEEEIDNRQTTKGYQMDYLLIRSRKYTHIVPYINTYMIECPPSIYQRILLK